MSTKDYSRYSLFPIQHSRLYELYKKQRDCFWVPAEVDLETDIKEWREKLTDDDRHFLTHTLAFFAQADGIVLQNVNVNFSFDVNIPEANLFYGIQAGIEAIHWEMYSILIETLVSPSEKQQAFSAIENFECIRQKAEWMLKWMDPEKASLGERLVAFACAEGIFFSSAFASIFYYKKKGLMPGLITSNEFISRDEGLHRDFGCELLKIVDPNIDPDTVYKIVVEAVEVECRYVEESLNVELIGINSESMKDYVKYTADLLLVEFGLKKNYAVKNPFDWMALISMTVKKNFFEGRVTQYKKSQSKVEFSLDTDF